MSILSPGASEIMPSGRAGSPAIAKYTASEVPAGRVAGAFLEGDVAIGITDLYSRENAIEVFRLDERGFQF